MPKGKHSNHIKGSRHHRWGKQLKNADGYVKIRVGRDHPLADPNGYAYEHLVVWCAAGNPRPDSDSIIHHRNNDKADNRLENLQLMTRSEHNAHHNIERGRDPKTGRFIGKKRAGRLLDGREWNEFPETNQ